ncbi:hypothetical protein SETIT_7G069800v2 [Setaria italica]|uniref:Uncharacterized protein n=1 Tax=Setaria italica TaxID=4555 RepID=A0A368RT05_SETIT|nr:hypothetical protein SETIT_7G069800v2 [Setaria italica]
MMDPANPVMPCHPALLSFPFLIDCNSIIPDLCIVPWRLICWHSDSPNLVAQSWPSGGVRQLALLSLATWKLKSSQSGAAMCAAPGTVPEASGHKFGLCLPPCHTHAPDVHPRPISLFEVVEL